MSFLGDVFEGTKSTFGGKNATQGFLYGGLLTGGVGAIPGLIVGSFMDISQKQADAQQKAIKKAEQLRIQEVLREFGRKQQADNAMLTAAGRDATMSAARTSLGPVPQPSTIGSAVPNGSAGTF